MALESMEFRVAGPYRVNRTTWKPVSDILLCLQHVTGYREVSCADFVFRPYVEAPLNESIIQPPNFEILNIYSDYRGLKLSWYKHPLRAAYCNMDLDETEIRELSVDILSYIINEAFNE